MGRMPVVSLIDSSDKRQFYRMICRAGIGWEKLQGRASLDYTDTYYATSAANKFACSSAAIVSTGPLISCGCPTTITSDCARDTATLIR